MGAHRPVIRAREHAIAAGHYLATEAGHAILNGGGNAIDAGVAAGITLGVVHSDLVNVAGVAPIMIRPAATGEVVTIDGLGTWPAAASAELFRREHGGVIPEGVLRTVVPAAPAAWIMALERFGTISFAAAAAAAIRHARDGFAMFPLFAENIAEHEDDYRRWPANRDIYLPRGRPPRVGELFRQTDLARTLQYMADEEKGRAGAGREAGLRAARDAFYRGDIARVIADYHRGNGGLLSMDDMADYRVRFEPPVVAAFKGLDIYACGPWSQGPSLAQAFALLDGIDIAGLGHNTPAYIHTVAEAIKVVFADRERYVGDAAFVDVPLEGLLADDYLAQRRQLIRPDEAWTVLPPAGEPAGASASQPPPPAARAVGAQAAPGGTEPPGLDTSYVCVVDGDGNIFSATPSDVSSDTPVIPGTGLCPSSRGSQSRTDAGHAARVAPGKRPRLTPNPALALKDGKPFMVFGTPGGDVQVQAMVQTVINAVVFGMDIQSAIEAPRFGTYSFPSSFAPHPEYPGLLKLEGRIPTATGEALAALGHDIETWPDWTWRAGGMCAIVCDAEEGLLHAGADPRREGYAMGR